jgi:hypothetical protein
MGRRGISTTAHLDPYYGPQDHEGWKKGIHRSKNKSRLYEMMNMYMEMLCIVVNSERNFFKAGLAKAVDQYLSDREGIEGRELARQELINAIQKAMDEYI